jgi:hypothetical protein
VARGRGTPFVGWRFGHPTIEWCDFGDLAFTDPLFFRTYARLRRKRADGLTWEPELPAT